MKRYVFMAALAAALCPGLATAQVGKQVEVTKAYVPTLESASKLPSVPDMTDTARMRPEIDYTITPLALATSLTTRPIRPATVTYWEFNRPRPLYLKLGAGYPLASVADLYVATQNSGTGYALGYINHEGRYADIANDFGVKNPSTVMFNRIGAAAGKYFGRHTLEGELFYDNRMYHRYGAFYGPDTDASAWPAPGAMADYGEARVAVRFGDDFKDLTRTNFDVALHGGLFFDSSEGPGYADPARQTTFGVDGRLARGFGRHRFALEAGYERLAGQKATDGYVEHLIRAGLRYGIDGDFVRLDVGADYWYDKRSGDGGRSYVIPRARLDFDLGTPGIAPFLEADGGVRETSYRTLTRLNPYVANPAAAQRSAVEYDFRLGIGGSLWRGRMTYRAYASFSIRDHHIYWVHDALTALSTGAAPGPESFFSGVFTPMQGRQTVTSFNGEVEYRPVTAFSLRLGVHGYLYNDEERYLGGDPSFEGDLGLRYEGRRIAFGISARVQSARSWSSLFAGMPEAGAGEDAGAVPAVWHKLEVPFRVDLRALFEWKISSAVTFFAEGRNLANRPLYAIAGYPEYGAGCMAGVKLNF